MLNRVVLMGRLTRDPELKHTQAGTPVCTITLAVERNSGTPGEPREADFFDCVCWNQKGEFVSRWFHKGQLVAVEGHLQSRKWQDKNGQNRVTYEVIAEGCFFAERGQGEPSPAPSASLGEAFGNHAPQITAEQARSLGTGFEAFEDDDDVPF